MSQLKFLEQFDTNPSAETALAQLQDLPGFDAGYEAGIAAADLRQTQLSQTVVDKLNELRFSQAEAQQYILNSLKPFMIALCDQVLPSLVDDIVRVQIIETLTQAAQHDVSTGVFISVHPSQTSALQAILDATPELQVQIKTDTSLEDQQVLIGNSDYETQLDVPGLIANVRAAFSAVIGHDERSEQHG